MFLLTAWLKVAPFWAYRKDCGPLGSRGMLTFAEHEKLTTGDFATHVVPAGVAREQNRRFC